MNNNLIKIEKINISIDTDTNQEITSLKTKTTKILGISKKDAINLTITKKAIDARDKKNIKFIFSVIIKVHNANKILHKTSKKTIKKYNIKGANPYIYKIKKTKNNPSKKPIIVGSGPAGLFTGLILAQAGFQPLIIERGKDVNTRSKDVELFFKNGELKENSNIQFGEGGAGTFSDGKLHTLVNDPRSRYIFEEFVKAGAPKEILYDAKPHIGTDKLKIVVKNLRKKIILLGGEIRFSNHMSNVQTKNNSILSIEINNSQTIETQDLILAIGHSARDTYEMLYKNNIKFEQKPFSIGVRIEHKTEMINESQFSNCHRNPNLPTASYRLAHHSKENRSVYSFCMCPGGHIIAASSEKEKLTINGMSEYKQNSPMSNSALLVNILPNDFESKHPLAGIYFQRKREEKAFIAGGENYHAPAQFVGDFIKGEPSFSTKNIFSTYKPGITLTDLKRCLPNYVISALQEALPFFDRKIQGFANPDTLLVGIEARSSAPVRMLRDKGTLQSNIKGIYPTGEGAGYAGGITSAAIDGMKIAEKIIEKYNK